MDIALRRLLRRLDDQLLEHLRAHCAEQAARIDELEAQIVLLDEKNERLRDEVIDADGRAEMLRDIVARLQDGANPPGHVGITTDGSIVLLPAEPERARA